MRARWSRTTIRTMGIYDEQREIDRLDYLASLGEDLEQPENCDEDDCYDGPDWIPGCDSIANHCESYPYN
jgi:hypothetical protein